MLLSGALVDVALAVKAAIENGSSSPILVFDDATGRVIDLDLRGTNAETIERLSRSPEASVGRYRHPPSEAPPSENEAFGPRGRGRPKLGVISREVTLLPRHWEWLAAQPGGASIVLRRLVEEARRNDCIGRQPAAAKEASYQFMLGIAGDLPGYEEATRALFTGDRQRLEHWIEGWPEDIRAHVLHLAFERVGSPHLSDN